VNPIRQVGRWVFFGLILWLPLSGVASAQAAADSEATQAARPRLFMPLRISLDRPEEGQERDLSTSVEIVLLLTFLTLLPPLLLTMTCFARVIIVLSFVRRAMATPEMPPNPVLIGLALFLSAAIMQPVAHSIHEKALKPYWNEELSFTDAGKAACDELKSFMLQHTREREVAVLMELNGAAPVANPQDLPMQIVIPAFALSELKTAFQMGFLLYLPFLVIDLVVASVLLALGMFMMPPMLIATPIKILLFVLIDGWTLVVHQLWATYGL
jgi:flagellar biosynthetic protein FliP